jgi:SAM-dependent methyltransferase
MDVVEDELRRVLHARIVDIGCGAGRNAVPAAERGARVVAADLSLPMLAACVRRAAEARVAARVSVVQATMNALPLAAGCADLVIAHGVWNLASTDAELRAAMAEAARVARPGAALFIFTFSRAMLAPDAQPADGQRFVFPGPDGQPHAFVDETELRALLQDAGFDPGGQLAHRGAAPPGRGILAPAPAFHEGLFRRAG